MEILNVNKLLQKLIDIESVTGNEAAIGNFLANYLRETGFEVEKMQVKNNRCNIFAKTGQPRIILQAHMDVVTPHISASEDDTWIYGRGACDTKGSLASMIVAAQRAKAAGITDFGLLFTVGEEVDFAGAKQAQRLIETLGAFLIVGEPTQLKPVTAHYGILVISLVTTGKAAHSSVPAAGENAIDKLMSLLQGPVKQLQVHKSTLMSIVQIAGGVADNIIPDRAEAIFSFRIAPDDTKKYATQLQELVGKEAKVEETQHLPPVASKMPTSLSFMGEGQVVTYCTELTFLKNGFVFGPGSIADAHSATERVAKADLKMAVEYYTRALKEYN